MTFSGNLDIQGIASFEGSKQRVNSCLALPEKSFVAIISSAVWDICFRGFVYYPNEYGWTISAQSVFESVYR